MLHSSPWRHPASLAGVCVGGDDGTVLWPGHVLRVCTGEEVPVMAGVLGPSVHYSIVLVDVEGFGSRRRTRTDQAAIRHGLYQALELAFTRSGVGWDGCYREDRGDGVLIL